MTLDKADSMSSEQGCSKMPAHSDGRGNSAMESMCMLDDSTPKHPTKLSSTFLNKLRALTNMKSHIQSEEKVTPDSYVVQNEETGPVCLLKDSPMKIFKCAQNGKAEEVAKIIKKDPSRLHARNPQGHMPIHVATTNGHLKVLEVLVGENADINAVDSDGNTALHLAVIMQSPEIVRFLMTHGAKSMLKNDSQLMPIHCAALEKSLEVMKALLDSGADPNAVGECGSTVLHYAAAFDNGDMLRLIVDKGAKICTKCDYGYYPIHIAARNAAANAMETLIEEALKNGYTKEEILNFRDRENNLPLHSAVNGGNLKAVSVCLNAGASVKEQQEDGSTPLHFACSQGNLDMIKLMKEIQAENFMEAVFVQDAMNMTPLHRATLFNHKPVVEYLLDEHADIEARDILERTPLLLAASKASWATLQVLINKGADKQVKDKNNRNFLHLLTKFGSKVKVLGEIDVAPDLEEVRHLPNEKDDFGCTPLHYASKEGDLYALDSLMEMGATLNLKNNLKQSPFYFAARYGRVNTCRRLLDSVQGPNLINETDRRGQSALHIAAKHGHTKVIELLLQRGAVISKDNKDKTALHHAASQGWTHSIKILLGVHQNLRDASNIGGDTALHMAAKNGKKAAVCLLLSLGAKILKNKDDACFFEYVIDSKRVDLAVAVINHDRWEEVLQYPSPAYGDYMLGLIQHLPTVCIITYNFKYLDPSAAEETTKEKSQSDKYNPMISLSAMVKNNRIDCLCHPVSITFLQTKWRHYGVWVHTAYLLVYIVFLASLTTFVVTENSLKHHDAELGRNASVEFLQGNHVTYECHSGLAACIWIITIYSILNIIREITQLISEKTRYFADVSNGLDWALYITSLLFVIPFLCHISIHWQWEAGAIAVFLAWFNCLVFLQRFDFFGIYVVMFLQILQTLVQALCVFSILIIAFGLSFYILMVKEDSKAFSTPGLALLRTFMMMLELDYMSSFNEQYVDGRPETLHFDNLTLAFLIVFVLFMPILLVNLLIGLAVGDIDVVQKDARLTRLAMQVNLHIDMEKRMPKSLRKYVQLTEYKYFPNKCHTVIANMLALITKTKPDDNRESNGDTDPQATYIHQELCKQKIKMRGMKEILEKNNKLLRKIMQKMDIRSEEDAQDEGGELNSDDSESEVRIVSRQYLARSARPSVSMKATVVDLWKKIRKE